MNWYRALTALLEPVVLAAARLVERGDAVLRAERRGVLAAAPGGHWFHAASAGEMRGLVPLIGSMPAAAPLVITAQTAAGRDAARAAFPGRAVHRLPFDLPGAMRRAFDTTGAATLVLAETELWPNGLDEAARRGVRTAIVNGRLSDRAWPGYRQSRGFWAPRLARLAAVAAQSGRDAERFVALGAAPDAVAVTGSMKHDRPAAAAPPAAHPWGRRPLLVLGSVRPGEELLVAEAARLVVHEHPGLVVVAAPRHRAADEAVERAFRSAGFAGGRRSRGAPAAADDFLLLDTMGELPAWYAAADAAVVGGTFARYGGHNVAEPAVAGVPVVFGPDTANCRLEADTLVATGGGRRATDADSLAAALTALLGDGRPAAVAGAGAALRALAGATARTRAFLAARGIPGMSA